MSIVNQNLKEAELTKLVKVLKTFIFMIQTVHCYHVCASITFPCFFPPCPSYEDYGQ